MMRVTNRLGALLALTAVLMVAYPGGAAAQLREDERPPKTAMERENEARILLDQAIRLEDRGELTPARLIYRDIIERYDGTVAAAQALERIANIEGRPDWGPGLPPVERDPGRRAPAPSTDMRKPSPGLSGLDQSGRTSVIVHSTVLATWLGLAIPIAAEADESTPYGIGMLLGAPAGLFTSLYATRDRKVTATQADVFSQASRMGAWHGLALGLIYDWDGEDVALATAIGGVAGAAFGTSLIVPGKNRESAASLSALAGTYGIWLGLVGSQVFGGESGGEEDNVATAMLAGGDLALAAAMLSSKKVSLSRSRGTLIAVSGAVGAAVGGATDLIFQIDDRSDAWALVGVGTIGGLITGTALTADYDRKRAFDDRVALSLPFEPVLRRDLAGGVMRGMKVFAARF